MAARGRRRLAGSCNDVGVPHVAMMERSDTASPNRVMMRSTMRHSAFFQNIDRSVVRTGRALLFSAVLGTSIMVAPAAVAQDATPAASPVASPAASPVAQAEVQSTNLMRTQFDEFIPAPMTVRLLRITLEPGASAPMHTHPGPEFDLVESGELTVRTDGEAEVTRANGDTEISADQELVLGGEDWIVYEPGTGMSYENTGDEPAVILSAVLLPVGSEFPESITYTEGQPTSQDFEGVSFQVLGDGLVQDMPSGSATVSIDSLVVPPGTDLPAADNVAMYSMVDGNFSFIVESGPVQVSRSSLQSLQPNAVIGEEFILEEGDAAFFPAGVTATGRPDETSSLELLSLTVDFDEEMNADPADLTFTSGISETGDATGGADAPRAGDSESDGTGAQVSGQVVTTNAGDLNMRAEPTTAADVVDQLAEGVELEVIGGPVEADGYTWYEVQVTAPGGRSGWVVEEFLDGLQAETAPEPTETPDADSTPAAANAGTFAVGDVVVTTDDSVRIRAEANLGGDIVDAFPAGTELEITGEPVEADEYVWYPVTVVDNPDISGWTTEDFIAPAE